MPRRGNPVFVPTGTKDAPPMLHVTDIPDEVVREVEEIYTALQTANGRIRVEFDTEEEAKLYFLQVDSYCRQRPAGEIRARRSPVRGEAKNVVNFRITDLLPEKEAEADETGEAPVKLSRKKVAQSVSE